MLQSKDINYVIEETAKRLGIDEELVSKVIRNQWKIIVNSMSAGKYKEIFLKNLGTFSVKTQASKLDDHIRGLIRRYYKAKEIYKQSLEWDNNKSINKYKWVIEENGPDKIKQDVYNFLQIRRKIKKVKKLKKDRSNMSMILIPQEKLSTYNQDNLPSTDYKEYIERVANRVRKMRGDHFEKFPEHDVTLNEDLSKTFDESVLKCIIDKKEEPIENGIVLIYSELFKKDDCLQTGFFIQI